MDFGLATYALGYLAGALSTLSPCVLPLLPILVATALGQHRFGPLALALGVTVSYAVVGISLASLGSSGVIGADALREGAAWLMVAFALVMLIPALQTRFAAIVGRFGSGADGLLTRAGGVGWRGQFIVGVLLGIVWSPCVGPTLGAASTYAAQGRDLGRVALLLVLFGLGAGTPLVVVGSLSREALGRSRGALLAVGNRGRWLLGAALLVIGLGIATGRDKVVETWLLDHSPDWLTTITTRY